MTLVLTALLCSGCTGEAEVYNRLKEQENSTFTADCMTKHVIGGIENTYTLRMRYAAGEASLTVEAPEAHRGLTVRVCGQEQKLSWGEVELVVPGAESPSVFAVLCSVADSLRQGSFEAVGRERREGQDCVLVCTEATVQGCEVYHRIWLSCESGLPAVSATDTPAGSILCSWSECETGKG